MRVSRNRGFVTFLVMLLLSVCIVLPTAAALSHAQTLPSIPDGGYLTHLPRMVDDAHLLTSEQVAVLETQLLSFAQSHRIDVAIVTVNSFEETSLRAFAENFFDYNGYGYGSRADGALLAISMEPGNRAVWITTTGYGMTVYNDDRIETMLDKVTPYLSDGEYAKAFEEFIRITKRYVEATEKGDSSDVVAKEKDFVSYAVAAGIGLVLSTAVMVMWGSTMKTIRAQSAAADYVSRPLNLTMSNDVFLYTTTTRTAKSENKSSSGGRIGGSGGSSGRSHGGGGRSF